jgi:integrase
MNEPTKKPVGRPAAEQLAPGQRGKMINGIRRRMGSDGKTLTYEVKVAGLDPKTGKHRATWKTFNTASEAKAAVEELRTQRRKGVMALPSDWTVETWLAHYVDSAQVAGTSRERYQNFAAAINKIIGSAKLGRLTTSDIRRLEPALQQAGYSERTALHTVNLLKSALTRAVDDNVLARNPAPMARRKRLGDPDATPLEPQARHALSPEDLAAIQRLTAADSLIALPVRVICHTGLRRGEATALRWSDVDLDGKKLAVRATVRVTSEKGKHIGRPKSENSARAVHIDDGLVDALRAERARQAEVGLAAGLTLTGEWHVFPWNDPRTPLSPTTFGGRFKAAMSQSKKYKDVTPHDLRHAHGSILLAAGAPIAAIARRQGHSVQMFLKTYAHAIEGDSAALGELFARVAKSCTDASADAEQNVKPLKQIGNS